MKALTWATVAFCLTAAGCAKEGAKPAGESARAGTPGAGGKFTIAMIGKSSNNPVFLAARTGAEQAAKDLSAKNNMQIEIAWLTPPQEDGEVQAQRIRQAVNDGASAVLIAASDAGKVTGAINDAVDRGVPVMTFDSDAPQSKRFAYYGVDDLKTGQMMMAELVQQLGGKGRVA
ncbi:MAG TPA: substrate-binding domain-containing protein, partial [Gemmatimonadaceae bacterium]|nr:substrate-binding domain-containing protein [Gemmatimonadaceae bacterium]